MIWRPSDSFSLEFILVESKRIDHHFPLLPCENLYLTRYLANESIFNVVSQIFLSPYWQLLFRLKAIWTLSLSVTSFTAQLISAEWQVSLPHYSYSSNSWSQGPRLWHRIVSQTLRSRLVSSCFLARLLLVLFPSKELICAHMRAPYPWIIQICISLRVTSFRFFKRQLCQNWIFPSFSFFWWTWGPETWAWPFAWRPGGCCWSTCTGPWYTIVLASLILDEHHWTS